MSQNTFPFAEGDDTESFAQEAEGGNRKVVLVAGGLAAALVLGAGGWFLLGGSSNDGSLNNTSFVPAKPRAVAAAPNKLAVKPVKKLPVAYKVPLGRDPFKALYVVPVAAPVAATTTSTGTSTGTGTTGTTGSTTVSGTTTPAGSTRYTVKLVSMSTPKPGEARFYNWLVAGTAKTVIPAQRFGKFGELVVLALETDSAGKPIGAVIQVGDDSPIDVKIGESVSVL